MCVCVCPASFVGVLSAAWRGWRGQHLTCAVETRESVSAKSLVSFGPCLVQRRHLRGADDKRRIYIFRSTHRQTLYGRGGRKRREITAGGVRRPWTPSSSSLRGDSRRRRGASGRSRPHRRHAPRQRPHAPLRPRWRQRRLFAPRTAALPCRRPLPSSPARPLRLPPISTPRTRRSRCPRCRRQ